MSTRKSSKPIGPQLEGEWPADCIQRAFVAGAKWWQYHAHGSTAFSSEVIEMEDEAVARYGDPLSESNSQERKKE